MLRVVLLVGGRRWSVERAGRVGSVLLAVALLGCAGRRWVALGIAGRLESVLRAVALLVGGGRR